MNARGKKIYGIGATKSKIPSGAIVYFIMGAVFGGAGLLGSAGDEPQWFLIIMGIMFGSFGALAYRRAKDIGLQC
jgi:membrane associated rhomboid family serine protease